MSVIAVDESLLLLAAAVGLAYPGTGSFLHESCDLKYALKSSKGAAAQACVHKETKVLKLNEPWVTFTASPSPSPSPSLSPR